MIRGVPKKRRFGSGLRWLMLGLAVLAVLASSGFIREALRSRQINREIASLKAEADNLRAKNFQITSLQGAADQQEFLEREARLNLNLKKEGEQVVVVKSASDIKPQTPDLAPEAPFGSLTNARKWWIYFTDRNAYDRYAAAVRDAGQTIQ